jgi:hypothetical protein
VSMVTMVLMVSPVPQVTVVPQLHQPQNCWAAAKNSAHAILAPLVMLDPPDQRDQMDQLVMLDPEVLMVNQAAQADVDHPDQPALLETPEPKAHPAQLARPPDHALDLPDHPDQLANQVLQAPMVNPVAPERMVDLVALAPPEMLVLTATLANKEALVPPETLASKDHLALATTAHLPVWLQVIKT